MSLTTQEEILLEEDFHLTAEVKRQYKQWGYTQAFITGAQGDGKTTYSLHTAYQIYRDWDKALEHLYFDPKNFLPVYKKCLVERTRLPFVVFDDAGIHLSKYKWFIDRRGQMMTMWVNSMFNTIRTVLGCAVFTSPDADIFKELREKSWIIGQPENRKGEPLSAHKKEIKLYRTAHLPYKFYKRIATRLGSDNFTLWLPNDIRKEYEDRRNVALMSLQEQMDNITFKIDEDGTSRPVAFKSKKNAVIEAYETLKKKLGYEPSKSEVARTAKVDRGVAIKHLARYKLDIETRMGDVPTTTADSVRGKDYDIPPKEKPEDRYKKSFDPLANLDKDDGYVEQE